MSKKKNRSYLLFYEDIIKAIEKIEQYTQDITYVDFCERTVIVDAVVRNLEIIGEAANKIPKEYQEKYPYIEWRQMIGFRNILIHNYFEVDVESVWDTIKKNIPHLKTHIRKAYNSEIDEQNIQD